MEERQPGHYEYREKPRTYISGTNVIRERFRFRNWIKAWEIRQRHLLGGKQ